MALTFGTWTGMTLIPSTQLMFSSNLLSLATTAQYVLKGNQTRNTRSSLVGVGKHAEQSVIFEVGKKDE